MTTTATGRIPTDPRVVTERYLDRLNAGPCCDAAPHSPEAPCYVNRVSLSAVR